MENEFELKTKTKDMVVIVSGFKNKEQVKLFIKEIKNYWS